MAMFFTVILILSSIVLIASILLQHGKSAGLSGTIGGGAEQLFGKKKGRSYDTLLDKITKIAAPVFIISALLVFYFQ